MAVLGHLTSWHRLKSLTSGWATSGPAPLLSPPEAEEGTDRTGCPGTWPGWVQEPLCDASWPHQGHSPVAVPLGRGTQQAASTPGWPGPSRVSAGLEPWQSRQRGGPRPPPTSAAPLGASLRSPVSSAPEGAGLLPVKRPVHLLLFRSRPAALRIPAGVLGESGGGRSEQPVGAPVPTASKQTPGLAPWELEAPWGLQAEGHSARTREDLSP